VTRKTFFSGCNHDYCNARGEPVKKMVKRIQFVSDHLIEQILEKQKTASVTRLENLNHDEDEYNQALLVGAFYDVYDSKFVKRCTIRITAIELCQWNNIPERLWRGETNKNASEFREDHDEYFNYPPDSFEFAAYYFQLITIPR
jgi:uncharacterized protein YhfF